jgi:hypothetical protein
LRKRPTHNDVRDRHPINFSPLQFFEEAAHNEMRCNRCMIAQKLYSSSRAQKRSALRDVNWCLTLQMDDAEPSALSVRCIIRSPRNTEANEVGS